MEHCGKMVSIRDHARGPDLVWTVQAWTGVVTMDGPGHSQDDMHEGTNNNSDHSCTHGLGQSYSQ